MLIDIPKNYKPTKGSLKDPIRYLTGKIGNSFSQWESFPYKYPLLDHCETFIDLTTKERIFVSHPYVEHPKLLEEMRKVFEVCGVDMIWFQDSWYHQNAWRIELRNAKIRSAIAKGESRRVLRQGCRSVLVG